MTQPGPAERPRSPYPGLPPFGRSDAPIFFGRGEQVDEMLSKLEDHRFLAVIGASGSGKSSLVRAGLLPALEDGFLFGAGPEWRMVAHRPGDAPFQNLAEALSFAVARRMPGEDPQHSFIEATLRSGPLGLVEAIGDSHLPDGTNVAVLVDQFEELFRFRRTRRRGKDGRVDPGEQQRTEAAAFVNLLLSTAAHSDVPVYVIITMRSDFLGDCDAFFGLPESINRCQFLTPRMTRDQLRNAITGPLDLFGATATPALVNCILNDVGSDPDQLPLMQHALMRMWSIANDRAKEENGQVRLIQDDYRAIGGLEKALSLHADEVFERLGQDGQRGEQKQRVAQLMFRCLCEREAEARITRRPTNVGDIAEVAGVDHDLVEVVAATFVQTGHNFLTSTASGPPPWGRDCVLDISHEALIRQWGRLSGWVEEEHKSATNYRRLAESANRESAGRGELLRGLELADMQNWRKRERPTVAWAERYIGGSFDNAMRFLERSAEKEHLDQEAEKERQRQERESKQRELEAAQRLADTEKRAAKRSKRLAAVVGLVAVSALAFGILAIWMSLAADRARDKAEDEREQLVSALTRSIGQIQDQPLNEVEVGVLWYVSTRSDVAEHFLEKALEDPVSAENLRWRAREAAQAAVGLNDTRRRKIVNLLIEKVGDPQTDPRIRETCVDIGLALQVKDSRFAAPALRFVGRHAEATWNDEDLELLAAIVAETQTKSTVVELLNCDYLPTSVYFLLLESLSREDAKLVVNDLIRDEILPQFDGIRLALGPNALLADLAKFSNYVSEDNAQQIGAIVLGQLEDRDITAELWVTERTADALAKLSEIPAAITEQQLSKWAARLTQAVSAHQTKLTPDTLENSEYVPFELTELPRSIVRLSERLDPSDASKLCNETAKLLINAGVFRDRLAERPFGEFEKLAARVDNAEVLELITRQLESADDGGDIALLYVLGLTNETLLQAGTITEDQGRTYAKSLSKVTEKLRPKPYSLSDDEFDHLVEILRRAGYSDKIGLTPSEELPTPNVEGVMDYWGQIVDRNDGTPRRSVSWTEVEKLEQVANRLTVNQRAVIAKGIIHTATGLITERQRFRDHPQITAQDDLRELPTLGEYTARKAEREAVRRGGMLELAEAFDSLYLTGKSGDVIHALEKEDASRELQKIDEAMQKSPIRDDLLGLVMIMIRIAPKSKPEVAHAAAVTIAKRFGTMYDNDHATCVHAFWALAKRLTAAELIEFLKWPTCVGWQRGVIVEELGSKRHFNQNFVDMWALVDWVKKNDDQLDPEILLTPPKRPD